jgi:hypothetical protein
MPWMIARYPYLETDSELEASAWKPIVWVALSVNNNFTVLPAAPATERIRTGLSPQAARAVDYSERQVVELQFVSQQSRMPVGAAVGLMPQLDRQLDDPARAGVLAPPWYQHPLILLGQDFLKHFAVALLGPQRVTVVFDEAEESEDEEDDV